MVLSEPQIILIISFSQIKTIYSSSSKILNNDFSKLSFSILSSAVLDIKALILSFFVILSEDNCFIFNGVFSLLSTKCSIFFLIANISSLREKFSIYNLFISPFNSKISFDFSSSLLKKSILSLAISFDELLISSKFFF